MVAPAGPDKLALGEPWGFHSWRTTEVGRAAAATRLVDLVRSLLETAERQRLISTSAAQRKELAATLDDLDRLLNR